MKWVGRSSTGWGCVGSILLCAGLLLVTLGPLAGPWMPGDGVQAAAARAESAPDLATPVCVDFEDLTLGATYGIGDTFVDSGAVVTGHPFTWSNGTVFSGGSVQVQDAGLAGGSGKELAVNNINLDFDFGAPLSGLSFQFGEYGGNLNIEVNGDFVNFDNFANIHGATIGGVDVSVINGLGNDTGWVRLDGTVHSLLVGGQELWLDDVCPETDCVDFEDLTMGAAYNVGDSFTDSGVHIEALPFVWSNGTVFNGGMARVVNSGLAGGSGLEINTNNINLSFDFGAPLPKGLSLQFGEYGGNLNVEINGDFANFQNFDDVDGTTIGGVLVEAMGGGGGGTGHLFLFGTVYDFAVGGQELWIDNVCPETSCVDYESLPLSATFNVGDTFLDSGATMEVLPFEWSNGTVFSGGQALIQAGGLAGGSGKELNTNNVNVAFHFAGPLQGLSLLFGEYGGNLNVEVNGDFVNFDNFADIDGATIGGAAVSAVNGLGNDKGRLRLDGIVNTFTVGGQELWIDDVCPEHFPNHLFLTPIMTSAP